MRETMIRNLAYFVMAGLILMCMSCRLKEDQMGYPRTVTFSKEGGEKIIKGGQVSPLFIGRHCSFDYTPILIIVAEPNTSGKSRMLRIFVYSGYQYATIEVKQE